MSQQDALPRTLGPYAVLGVIGAGGQGTVFKVRNPGLDRIEALKMLRVGTVAEDDRRRFEREARVLAQLRHPNIIPVFDVGTIEGRPYYTMEFVEGDSVMSILDRVKRLPPRLALRIIRDAARAMAVAHGLGIIHRDLKPHNLMVMEGIDVEHTPLKADERLDLSTGRIHRLRVLVTDFGLAREGGKRSDLTETGMIFGTPAYASPEAAEGMEAWIDARADVYGLGATLYHMLAGRPPFEGRHQMDVLQKVAVEEAVPVRRIVPGISREIETIVQTCMAKERARRYPSAGALADDIDRMLKGELIRARPAGPLYRGYRWIKRRRALVGAIGGSLLAGVAVAVLWVGMPEWRRAAEDRAALERARTAKRDVEREFRALLDREEFDAAVELGRRHYGVVPPGLSTQYEINLAEAYRRRGLRRLARSDPLGRGDLAAAYRSGRDSAPDVAREALIDLAAVSSPESAERIVRLIASNFGTDDPRHRELLAAAYERVGRLEEAAGLRPRVPPDLAMLLPRQRLLVPRGTFDVNEATGEIVHAGREGAVWIVQVFAFAAGEWTVRERIEVPVDPAAGGPSMVAVRGDEALIGGAVAEGGGGTLLRVRLGGGPLAVVGAIPIASPPMRAQFIGDRAVVSLNYFDRALLVLDLSGDGIRVERAIRLGCDPHAFRVDGDRLLVWLGPWLVDLGFRLAIYEGDAPAVESEPGLDNDRPAAFWQDERTLVLAARAVPERVKVMPSLREGLFRVTFDDDIDIEPIGPDWSRHGDWTPAGCLPDGRVVAIGRGELAIFGGETRRFGVGAAALHARVVDLDGDGEPEVVAGNYTQIDVYGRGRFVPEPPERVLAPLLATGAPATPEQELLDAGLFAEAEAACREGLAARDDPALWFTLGRALAGLERWTEAAEALERAPWTLATLMERAHALRNARAWEAMVECLRAVIDAPGAGPFERAWAREQLDWAEPAAAMRPALSWRAGDAIDAFVCQNPFKVRADGDGLHFWSSADTHGDLGGIPFHYLGGPLRIAFRFRMDAVAWETTSSLGIQRIDALSVGPARAPRALVRIWGKGASDRPAVTVEANYAGNGSEYQVATLPTDAFVPDPDAEYEAVLEFVPGLDRLFVEIGGHRLELRAPFPLTPGVYFVGRCSRDDRGPGLGPAATRLTVESLSIESTDAAVRPATFEPSTPDEWMAWAGGRLVAGDPDGAVEGYGRAGGGLLFRALAHYRRGRVREAERDVRAADAESRTKLLSPAASAALTPMERGFLIDPGSEF